MSLLALASPLAELAERRSIILRISYKLFGDPIVQEVFHFFPSAETSWGAAVSALSDFLSHSIRTVG